MNDAQVAEMLNFIKSLSELTVTRKENFALYSWSQEAKTLMEFLNPDAEVSGE